MPLTDMDELLESVIDPEMTSLMREASSCYHCGAYRACIVMSCIALFSDIQSKIGAMAPFNSDAKTLHLEIQRRVALQDVFEDYMLTQLGSKTLIDKLDKQRADRIRDLRNKSAHPSGHTPNASEARFVFEEVIDLSLSRKTLLSKAHADHVVSRLLSGSIFISRIKSDMDVVVTGLLENLEPTAVSYLYQKVGDALSQGDPQGNLAEFICSSFRLAHAFPTLKLLSNGFPKAFSGNVTNANLCATVAYAVVVNGNFPSSLSNGEGPQSEQLFASLFSNSTITIQFNQWLLNSLEDWGKVSDGHSAVCLSAVQSFCIRNVTDKRTLQFCMNQLPFRSVWISHFNEMAASSTFTSANSAAQFIIDADQLLSKYLSNEESIYLLSSVAKAGAGASLYARASRNLSDGKFCGAPGLKAKVTAAININPTALDQFVHPGLHLQGSGGRASAFLSDYL